MKILVLLLSGLVIILAQKLTPLQKFVTGNQRFAADLYKSANEQAGDDNFLINPLALQMILSLALLYAKDETFKEIALILQLPVDSDDEVQLLFKEVSWNLENMGESILAIANKVFVKKGLQISDEQKVAAIHYFNSEIEPVNFLDKKSVDKINKWVKTNTNEATDLISTQSFNDGTKSVLVNLEYFKGYWQKGFPTRFTKLGTFYINRSLSVQTPLMEVSSIFKYAYNHTLRAQFIELPFQDSDVSLTIVLHDDKFGLSKLESQIGEIFHDQTYYGSKVRLLLPKFNIVSTMILDRSLKNLGIQNALDDANSKNGFEISNVYQKAILDLNEEGQPISSRRGKYVGKLQVDLIADHPFLFYIKSQSAGIFFIGRYAKPK